MKETAYGYQESQELVGQSCLEVLRYLLRKNPHVEQISVDEYLYIPQTLSEEGRRKSHVLTRSQFLEGKQLEQITAKLEPGWDLAVSSKVVLLDGRIAHFSDDGF